MEKKGLWVDSNTASHTRIISRKDTQKGIINQGMVEEAVGRRYHPLVRMNLNPRHSLMNYPINPGKFPKSVLATSRK